jgi:hypothetical protein
MIKSISLLTRKAGMTHEQFMTHWVEIHAPLARASPCGATSSRTSSPSRRPDI